MFSRQWMPALKLFLPSWNFFNDFSAVPRIEYRLLPAGAVATDWRPLFRNHDTCDVGRVLFNPAGNLELLEKSLVERAVDELELGPAGRDSFAGSETEAALIRMARARIGESLVTVAGERFQVRLVMTEPGAAPEVAFVSEEFAWAKVAA